jgi:elongation factor 1-alpha
MVVAGTMLSGTVKC